MCVCVWVSESVWHPLSRPRQTALLAPAMAVVPCLLCASYLQVGVAAALHNCALTPAGRTAALELQAVERVMRVMDCHCDVRQLLVPRALCEALFIRWGGGGNHMRPWELAMWGDLSSCVVVNVHPPPFWLVAVP
jgi:hypothetical protein